MGENLCGTGRSYNMETGRCELGVPDCFEQAVGTGITTGINTGPQNGLLAGIAGYLVCKGFQSVESSYDVPRQSDSPRWNRDNFDSSQQFPVDNPEPYYQESDSLLDNNFDTWRAEEDIWGVDDHKQDLTRDSDFRPS